MHANSEQMYSCTLHQLPPSVPPRGTHLELGPQEVVAAHKVEPERSGRIFGVPRVVDGRDDLVHPFAVGGGESEERGEGSVEDFERGAFDLCAERAQNWREEMQGGRNAR